MRADSLIGQIIAVMSRRTPALQSPSVVSRKATPDRILSLRVTRVAGGDDPETNDVESLDGKITNYSSGGDKRGEEPPYVWGRTADGKTRLIDAVLTVRVVKRASPSVSLTAPDRALVFATPGGVYDTYMPPHRPSRSEVASRRYTTMYEVDVSTNLITESITLPSADDAFQFDGDVSILWQVADPARFVASGVRDVPQHLMTEIQRIARRVTRRINIENSAEAESALQEAADSKSLGSSIGLHVSWSINVSQEERSKRLTHLVNEGISRFELELLVEHQRAETRRIGAQKAAFYQWHFETGGVTPWAHHLALHPEDSRLAVESMRVDQLETIGRRWRQINEIMQASGESDKNARELALQVIQEVLKERLGQRSTKR